jgi:hypothetical protein
MSLRWTDEAKAVLLARELEGAPRPRLPKEAKAWTDIKARLKPRQNWDPILANFVTHRGQATADNARRMEAAEALIRAEESPAADDVDALAALIVCLGYLASRRQILDWIAVKRGFPFAFRVGLRARDFAQGRPQHLIDAPPDGREVDESWRSVLRGVEPEVRAECKEIARAAWPTARLGQRTTIAYTFFEEAEWGDQVAKQWLPEKFRPLAYLYPIVRDFDVAKELVLKRENARSFLELVATFGEAMLPILLEVGAAPQNPYDLKYAAEALSLYDDERVAAWLASLVAKTKVRPYVQAYFAVHPDRAEAAFAPLVKGKTKAAKVAAEFLASATRAAGTTVDPSNEATLEELPKILREPPWEAAKRPKRPTTVLELPPLELPERIAWRDGEKERCLARFRTAYPSKVNATAEQIEEFRQAAEKAREQKHRNLNPWMWRQGMLPADVALAAWNEGTAQMDSGTRVIGHALARFGEAAFPGLALWIETSLGSAWGDARELLVADSPRLAPAIATLLSNKRRGVLAWQWMEKNANSAVLGLVPVAFGPEGPRRVAAESALIRLAGSGVDVVGLAAPWGKDAAKALAKLLEWDPIYDCPKKVPKLGASFRPETFSRPRLRNGKPLPLQALVRVAEMLAFTPLDPPYAGIVQLKEACDEHSLAELAWELARAWEHGGAKAKEKWMLMALVPLADDEVTRRMTPGIRTDYAVEALEVMGTDAALMELATIAGRQNAQGEWSLAGRIETMLDAAASIRGVTKDELEEDLAPTTELDADASLSLEYGSRTLRVGFDERLAPYVRGEHGERLRGLPPARKDDDPVVVERAKVLWRDLKEDMTVIGMRRVRALERAMISGRTWTRERFVRVWQEDRLVKHLARGVLWSTKITPFRIAEDGSLADVEDSPFVLAEDDVVHVPHPLRLGAADLAAWRQIFEDYEVVQPFAQLGRQLPDVSDPKVRSMPWLAASATTSDVVTRLNRRGFRWSGGGGKLSYRKPLPSGGELVVSYVAVANVPTELVLGFELDGQPVELGALHAVEVAEALHELFAND